MTVTPATDPDPFLVNIFQIASDAFFADDVTTRRSTQRLLFRLYDGSIDWKSPKQKVVTTSTTEAEFNGPYLCRQRDLRLDPIVQGISFNLNHEIAILCDNKQTLGLMTREDPPVTTKLRHIAINTHWLRQKVQAKRLSVQWVPTTQMPADGLTKALP